MTTSLPGARSPFRTPGTPAAGTPPPAAGQAPPAGDREESPAGGSQRPRLLDLFCGAGGAAMGYYRAGFDVVGVDIAPQPHYPFEFLEYDALKVLQGLLSDGHFSWLSLRDFDAFHASPVCKLHTIATLSQRRGGKEYPNQIPPTRELLQATGLPWVIENVPGAPLRADYKLCGCMFGLPGLRRERWFETSWHGFAMNLCHDHTEPAISVTGHGTPAWARAKLGYNPTIAQYRVAMGIDWMNRDELSQAIPPAYTEFIGEQLLKHLRERAA